MERPTDRSEQIEPEIDARTSLALWLRAGRAHRGMSLDDVARVTKIQPRILERLETGQLDGLPAEVFVRGFVRSVARCVGLDEVEALRRYAACGGIAASSTDLTATARALVEAMAELVPATAARATPRKMTAVEVIDLRPSDDGAAPGEAPGPLSVAVEAPSSPPGGPSGSPSGSLTACDGLPIAAVPVVAVEPAAAEPVVDAMTVEAPVAAAASAAAVAGTGTAALGTAALGHADRDTKKKKNRRAKRNKRARDRMALGTPPAASPVVPGAAASGTWAPTMPPMSSVPSVPWRRPVAPATSSRSGSIVVPSLVIDDADPESAERVLERRAEKQEPRRSFLPPILLDREDRSARQGGLTLAVIILLIAATLTLSYLMRRPSASGDGMTRLDAPAAIAPAPADRS